MVSPANADNVRTWTNVAEDGEARRPVFRSMLRGAARLCPNCGRGRLFSSYLKVVDHCGVCGEAMHHHRADDAPPYFTIFIVGHVIVAALMNVEVMYEPPLWIHAAIWLPLTVALSLTLLPLVKGALVGLQWALKMHGFGEARADAPHPDGG